MQDINCLPLYNTLRRHVKGKSSLLASPLAPPSLPVPENAKLFAWVGDEILPREMAKVLKLYIHVYFVYVSDLKKTDVNIFLYSCLRFPFLTPWCKAVTLYGKVLESTKAKYSSLKNI